MNKSTEPTGTTAGTTVVEMSIKEKARLFMIGVASMCAAICITIGLLWLIYPPIPVYDDPVNFTDIMEPSINDRFKGVPFPSGNNGNMWNDTGDVIADTTAENATDDNLNKSIYDTMNASWLYENGYYGTGTDNTRPGHPVTEIKTVCAVVVGLFGLYLIVYKRRSYG